MIKLVVFDMAGTTIEDKHEVEKCFAIACEQMNLPISKERILALQGYSKIEVFKILWAEKIGVNHESFNDFVNESYTYFKDILEHHYLTNAVKPTEGCLEVFQYLKEHDIKIALTTGFYRAVANIILAKIGWLEGLNESYYNESGKSIIDLSITSDEVAKGRPEPLMIHKAMQIFKIKDSQQVINIGDTPSDLLSGIRAGCKMSLGITNGTHSHSQLKVYRNHGLLKNLTELPQLIESINKPS
jgi:phosphonatase-like hydrolase